MFIYERNSVGSTCTYRARSRANGSSIENNIPPYWWKSLLPSECTLILPMRGIEYSLRVAIRGSNFRATAARGMYVCDRFDPDTWMLWYERLRYVRPLFSFACMSEKLKFNSEFLFSEIYRLHFYAVASGAGCYPSVSPNGIYSDSKQKTEVIG